MIDGIIKADGTSRMMRAELPATYEEFRAQCRAGAQPLDVLFNAIGWSQLPTFLNKANLLKDTTAALFGLGTNAVPDDALAAIKNLLDGKSLNGHVHDASALTSGILPVARGGTGVSSLTALVSAMSAARIAVGEYRGNGGCQHDNGSSYKRTLNFGFQPQMIIFWDKQSHGYDSAGRNFGILYGRVSNDYIWYPSWSGQFGIFTPIVNKDSSTGCEYYWQVNDSRFDITFSGNAVSWSSYYASNMYNISSCTYGYIAIG